MSGVSATSFALPLTAPLAARLEHAAREQLERQAASAGLAEPRFEVALVAARAAPPCTQPVAIEALDTHSPARMRFLASCPDPGGWRYEYIVRAKVSALVAVTTSPVAPGQQIGDDQVALERRDISTVADPLGSVEAAVGQASRRSLRAGEVLRAGQLAAPVLVKRGDQVVMIARQRQIEVSTGGEALDAGSRGAVIRVRNSASGQVVRMRVTGPGTVEPVDLPLTP